MNFFERHPIASTGAAGWLAMLIHGVVPDTRAMPLIWPVLAGGVAVWLLGRRSGGAIPNIKALRGSLASGAVTGLVALIGFTVGYVMLTLPALAPIAMEMGATGKLPWTPVAIATIAGVLLLCLPAALLGGLIAVQFSRRR